MICYHDSLCDLKTLICDTQAVGRHASAGGLLKFYESNFQQQ